MRRLSILVSVLGLVAAACSGSTGDSTTTTTSPAETTTSVATEDTATTAASATTTTALADVTTTTTVQTAGSGGSECLVGTWVLDSEAFVDSLLDVFSESGLEAESLEPNDGIYTVEMSSDGTFTGTRDEWGFAVVLPEGTFNISITGTETGTWSTDGSTMTVQTEESDMTVSSTIEVGGQVQEMPQSPVDVPEAIASASEYSCDDDTLSVTNEGITTVMNRA